MKEISECFFKVPVVVQKEQELNFKVKNLCMLNKNVQLQPFVHAELKRTQACIE